MKGLSFKTAWKAAWASDIAERAEPEAFRFKARNNNK